MMYVFRATGQREGKSFVLLDKYQFVNGELVATAKDARAFKPILCDFYACTLHKVEQPDKDPTQVDLEDDDEELETAAGAQAQN